MALVLPTTAKEISQKAKVDVRREIASSDPFLARSYLGGIISGISNRVFEFYDAIRDSENEANPLTAVRNRLKWANTYGLTLLAGASSSGQIFVNASSGGIGVAIPINTRFVSGSGDVYIQQAAVTLQAITTLLSTITRVGTTATATTATDHGLASNAIITITGATETNYNVVSAVIIVTGARTFTYEMTADPGGSATGAPAYLRSGGTITIKSEQSGEAFNLDADASLAFETPIPTVESPALVTFEGVIDGTDLETPIQIQARLADLLQNPVALFSKAQIQKVTLGISGVTRVFVQSETPVVGQVTVYFMRDNDSDPIPDAAEVAEVLAALIAIKPAHTADADVIVAAPVEISTDFDFTAASLVPDTPTMRVALQNQLAEFFEKSTDVGVTIVEDAYRSAIFNTVDTSNGDRVSSFVLAKPTILVNAQDETSYDNAPTSEGVFSGGTGHVVADVLTMVDGSIVTVDAVSGGVVTQFTINAVLGRGASDAVAINQGVTTGVGVGFQLTPGPDNVTPATDLNVVTGSIRTLGTVSFT